MEAINPLTYRGWNEILQKTPDTSIFHTENWAAVLAGTYGYSPRYFVQRATDKFEFLMPVMEVHSWLTGHRGVCLPFSDDCPPVIGGSEGYEKRFSDVLAHTRNRGWKYLEVRGGKAPQGGATPSSSYYHHTLKLSNNPEKVFLSIRSNYRSKIKKAAEAGVGVEIRYDQEAMDAYYRLHCLTRRRHGVPPQPKAFFKNILDHIIAPNLGFIILASCKQEIIAGAVFFLWQKKAIYKFGASDLKFEKLYPNHLLFWHAFQWLCNHNYTEVSFGRTVKDNAGLLQFKDGWGAQREQLDYYKYHYQTRTFVTGNHDSSEEGHPLFRNLPTTLNRAIGAVLYRHVG